jgi:hypothetical protein
MGFLLLILIISIYKEQHCDVGAALMEEHNWVTFRRFI